MIDAINRYEAYMQVFCHYDRADNKGILNNNFSNFVFFHWKLKVIKQKIKVTFILTNLFSHSFLSIGHKETLYLYKSYNAFWYFHVFVSAILQCFLVFTVLYLHYYNLWALWCLPLNIKSMTLTLPLSLWPWSANFVLNP